MLIARLCHSKYMNAQGMETHQQIQIKEKLINTSSLTDSIKSHKTQVRQS
jgi:hypothetical protein